ncbi:hypothetical protein NMG60_11015055 [Bertholletia excelsa]
MNFTCSNKLSFSGCCLVMFVGCQGFPLCICWTTGPSLSIVFEWLTKLDFTYCFILVKPTQNGRLLAFDLHQTLRPVESMVGLACKPIHSIHTLSPDHSLTYGVKSLLIASCVGVSFF